MKQQAQTNQIEWKEVELEKDKMLKIRLIKKPKKNFIAKSSQFGMFNLGFISVDNLFSSFSKDEQKAILFHEYWHYKNNLKFEIKILFSKNFWIFFLNNKLSKLQEFEADKYAVSKTNKNLVIICLRKIKKFEDDGKIQCNYKNHPSIKERIENIK